MAGLKPESCICHACYTWARRQGSKVDCEKTEPAKKTARTCCEVSGCQEPKHAQCDINKINRALPGLLHAPASDTCGINCNRDESTALSAGLCSKHYRMVHRQAAEIKCHVCGKRQEKHNYFHRPMNTQFLQCGDLADANQAELATARLCDSCHAEEIRSYQGVASTDAALDNIIARQEATAAAANSDANPTENIIATSKATATAMVARKLRDNEAMLLVDVCQNRTPTSLSMEGKASLKHPTSLTT